MEPEASDDRHHGATERRHTAVQLLVRYLASILFIASLTLCLMTLRTPGRFIFLSAGDVGLGFRSAAGWVQWIENAPWERNPDYIELSVPWAVPLIAEALLVSAIFFGWPAPRPRETWHAA